LDRNDLAQITTNINPMMLMKVIGDDDKESDCNTVENSSRIKTNLEFSFRDK